MEPDVVVDAVLAEVALEGSDVLGQGVGHEGVLEGGEGLAFKEGLLVHPLAGSDVLVTVLLGKLTGQNLDVTALIALGGQGIGLLAAVLLEIADGEALAELLDLVARVIDIELAGHVVARPVEDSGQTVAQSAAAGVAHVHGAGGVGRDELHIVLCALAVVGAAILLVCAGTQHDAGPEGGGKEEVDEAGAGHLDLGEDTAGQVGQVGDEGVGDHLGGLAPGACTGHGDVGSDVAVLDVGGDLHDEGGQLGLGQSTVGHCGLGGGSQQGTGLVQRGLPRVVVLVGLFKVGHWYDSFHLRCISLVDVLYRHFQRVAADDAGIVGVQQVAERGAAAFFGQLTVDAVAGDAQRQRADLRLIVAEVAAVALDEELAVGPPEAEKSHSAAVLGDLDGGGAALEADGLCLFVGDVVAAVLFGKAAPGHQLDVVAVLLADDALVVELVDGAFDADDVIFNG